VRTIDNLGGIGIKAAAGGTRSTTFRSVVSVLVSFVRSFSTNSSGALLTTEPFALLADLLYAMGYALWTGVVVVVFVQVLPEVKRRQLKRWLDAYEAALREKAGAGSGQASGGDGAPTAR
jgi:hypothetical protein